MMANKPFNSSEFSAENGPKPNSVCDRTVDIHEYLSNTHRLWQKMTLFEESTRVPLIISVPGNPANGKSSLRTVELVDLHRTLADVYGLSPATATEGASLKPLIENPEAESTIPASTQIVRGGANNQMVGRTLRTEKWRYTEWNDGQRGVELYDHDADPKELNNLATNPQLETTATLLKLLLRQSAFSFIASFGKTDTKPTSKVTNPK